MKTLILTILMMICSVKSFSQGYIMWNTGQQTENGFHTTCQYLDEQGNLLASKYVVIINDTTSFYTDVDAFKVEYLKAGVDHGKAQSILWADSSGIFWTSNVNNIPITYNQIVDSLGFEPVQTLTGKDTLSGVNGMTAYVVAHNYGYIPVITLTPRSVDAAADCYISDIDSNTFTITFTNQPPIGTDNIIFDWVAIKP